MPLTEQDKIEAKQTLAGLIEMNEPEALVGSLRQVCERKSKDWFLSDSERSRWAQAEKALSEAMGKLERANAPKARAQGYIDEDNGQYVGPERRTPIKAEQLEKEHGRQGPPDPPEAA